METNTLSINNSLLQYKKLQMLKEAFFINDEEDVSEIMLLEEATEHNQEEFFLISFLVDTVITAPKVLKKQFDLLNKVDKIEIEYNKLYNETEKLLKTNTKCKKFAKLIYEDLELSDNRSFRISNMVLFGLCHEMITNTIGLSSKNFCINLHILKKWLDKQQKIGIDTLTELEQKIIIYFANGYTPQNLIQNNYTEFGISSELMFSLIYNVLPARCGVQSICQAMAVLYMSNPNLRDIKKSIQMLIQ